MNITFNENFVRKLFNIRFIITQNYIQFPVFKSAQNKRISRLFVQYCCSILWRDAFRIGVGVPLVLSRSSRLPRRRQANASNVLQTCLLPPHPSFSVSLSLSHTHTHTHTGVHFFRGLLSCWNRFSPFLRISLYHFFISLSLPLCHLSTIRCVISHKSADLIYSSICNRSVHKKTKKRVLKRWLLSLHVWSDLSRHTYESAYETLCILNAAYGSEVGQQIINRLEEEKLALLFTSHCHRHLFCCSS